MKKYIVTTTINSPTEATLRFASMSEWHLVVVGDTKTPHDEYRKIPNITYLSPEDQEKLCKPLSDAIGWRSIRRRNLPFVFFAYSQLKRAVLAPPICRKPVGEGANRVTTLLSIINLTPIT